MCWCAVKKLLTHSRRIDWVVSKTTQVYTLFSKSKNVTFIILSCCTGYTSYVLINTTDAAERVYL